MALLDAYTGAWTADTAAHLARRAGFGANPAEITSMVSAGMSSAVDAYIDYPAMDAPLEALIAALPSTGDGGNIKTPTSSTHLEGWWLYRMVFSSYPLQQQFALFLHDHFVSEYGKVSSGVTNSANEGNDGSNPSLQACTTGTLAPDPLRKSKIVIRLLQEQNSLFTQLGPGNYRTLLQAVTRDPAMLIYLDNRLNVKGKPQENYSREVMELFTMGVGNYTEEDVREIARAFTGETIDAACATGWPYSYVFKPTSHDTNAKIIFGSTVNLGSAYSAPGPCEETKTVLDMILNRIGNTSISPYHSTYPATAVYLGWKLLRWFVSDTIEISHAAVGELANFFYNNQPNGYRYDVRETLRKILKSQFFYDNANLYNMVKRPADYVAMALRNLGLTETSYTSSAPTSLRGMGMRLFQPPNVAGWNHGNAWINSGNLVYRFNYANRLSGTTIMTDAWCDALKPTYVATNDDNAGILEFFRARLLQYPLSAGEQTTFTTFYNAIFSGTGASISQYRRKVRGTVHLMMAMPRYQLK